MPKNINSITIITTLEGMSPPTMELLQALFTSEASLERKGGLRMSEQVRFCEAELSFMQDVKLCLFFSCFVMAQICFASTPA